MICSKCGNFNSDGARICAVCGASLAQTPSAAAPQNALSGPKRDTSVLTYVMMLLNAAFTLAAMLMMYIPTYWNRPVGEYRGAKKYYSYFSGMMRNYDKATSKDPKAFYVFVMVLIIGFSIAAAIGILLAILRVRASAGVLLAPSLFAVGMMFTDVTDSLRRAMYHGPKEYSSLIFGYLPQLTLGFFCAIAAVAMSMVVFAIYRKPDAAE